ncbi:MAG: thermonuclease family protein [Pseudomonadota bacterium]|nr:thermonuclease family protein [Pseudomonadota bacterium]
MRVIVLLVLMLIHSTPALADGLKSAGTASVAEVIDGDTVRLSDGREVRLTGIQAPKLPLGRKDFPVWPLAPEAKQALESLVLDRTVELRTGEATMDRWGRALVHLYRDDGLWIQGEMLRQGWARVYSFPDNRVLVDDMLVLEKQARGRGLGIWALDHYAVRPADEVTGKDFHAFLVAEGRVVKAAAVKGQVFLNFGHDWRTDFTVVIPRPALKLFRRAGVDPLAFEGRDIQVRGWVEMYNGPMIEATHPEAIVPLDRKGVLAGKHKPLTKRKGHGKGRSHTDQLQDGEGS